MKSKMEDGPKRGRGRGRGGRGRARGRGRGRGRGKKATKVIESDEEVEPQPVEAVDNVDTAQPEIETNDGPPVGPPPIDLEADISQLEAPTFTTINRGPPEPMLRLNWTHKVNLIGEKVLNPMIHCCDKCLKPILIYGRMIPCKHVFCLACGKKEQKQCPRCLEKVTRVEQTGLGTVFMCTHGGTRYGQSGCRRTYLSQRDLQAHINHRHVSNVTQQVIETVEPERALPVRAKTANDPRSNVIASSIRQRPALVIQSSSGVSRANLITVPIQESPTVHDIPTTQSYYNQYPQTASYTQTLPPMHIPPPQQPQYYTAPPAYSPAQNYPAYTGTAAPPTSQYATPAPAQARPTPQYDYSAAPPQWTNNQQYYR